MKKILVDKCASMGIAMGKVFLVNRPDITPAEYSVTEEEKGTEIQKFQHAVDTVTANLEEAAKESEIFAAHIELVKDFALKDSVETMIRSGVGNVEQAIAESCNRFVSMFEAMEDEYMRERAVDMKDIKERLLMSVKGINPNPFAAMEEPCIIVATDLAPSDTVRMKKELVLGFITQFGGVTSHVAIIAKNLGLPALVGVTGLMQNVADRDEIILDATGKTIIFKPDEETKNFYKEAVQRTNEENALYAKLKGVPAVTRDGKTVEICANVGNVEDIKTAKEFGFDGIGLFRSEFLYMENTHFPTEEEQFAVYKEAVLTAEKYVIVRTLDIGGDKGLPYFEFEKEENPFLGWRAIRICLEMTDMFKAQLRALLRASAFGDIRIMYPMIISEDELDKADSILEECKKELDIEGKAYNKNIQIGIMIETPAAVICAPELAKKVDFFSIGTNDLTQYITAVDRGNKKISYLYDSFNPAVLRAIKMVINAGHAAGIPVGMCGEFASDEKAAKLLLGMGLDEFSMSASCMNRVKALIREMNYKEISESTEVKRI
ncbi:MAG: phosphoenolpyruvate--protein phosphotransferase [Lachnospiraceae bacterium]|nr:phosphoenolpyruvate--protein phosphotransferase [Lachnospiraceae bacterium]